MWLRAVPLLHARVIRWEALVTAHRGVDLLIRGIQRRRYSDVQLLANGVHNY